MKQALLDQLHGYLVSHHPDRIINRPGGQTLEQYLIAELDQLSSFLQSLANSGLSEAQLKVRCLNQFKAKLGPSRYLHLKALLKAEFPGDYLQMREAGRLTLELVNLITVCAQIFKAMDFSTEKQQNSLLKYALIGQIREYLQATTL